MQVKLLYTDNSYTISDVIYSYQNFTQAYCVEALRWSDIAWQENESISSSFTIRSMDGKEYYSTNIEGLEHGEHTVGLGIYHYINGTGSSEYEKHKVTYPIDRHIYGDNDNSTGMEGW